MRDVAYMLAGVHTQPALLLKISAKVERSRVESVDVCVLFFHGSGEYIGPVYVKED